MAQYPSLALGSGLMANRQQYGLTGMSQAPYLSGIIRKEASNLPALYALRGSQKQKERELSLAEQALGQNLSFEKERLASTERLAGEELALTKQLAESESEQRERLAKEQLEQEKEQAGKGNLISGISTGTSIGLAGLKIGGWIKDKMAEEAAKKALVGPSLTSSTAPMATGAFGPAGASTDLAAIGSEIPAGYGADAYLGITAAPTATAAGTTATAAGANLGTLSASEAAAASGTGVAGAGASMYTGPAAVIALPLLTGISQRSSERKTKHAMEDFLNSLSPAEREAYLNFTNTRQRWNEAIIEGWPGWNEQMRAQRPDDYDPSIYNLRNSYAWGEAPSFLTPQSKLKSSFTGGSFQDYEKFLSDQANWKNG